MRARTLQRLPLLVLLSLLGACSAGGPPVSDEDERDEAAVAAQQAAESAAAPADGPAAVPPPAPTCDASQVQGLVGKAADEATVEQARIDAGATRARVLKPGQAVTMEFDGARLNLEVDADDKVVALRCG